MTWQVEEFKCIFVLTHNSSTPIYVYVRQPGYNVALDSFWASATFFVCCYNLGWRRAYCTIPICIFYYTRGQLSDPMDPRKLYDHAMWHWTGQSFRVASLIFADIGPKDWKYEITWQMPVYACVLFSMRYLEALGGGLTVFAPLFVYSVHLESKRVVAQDKDGYVGLKVAKYFHGKLYEGVVKCRSGKWWKIVFEDGDEKEWNTTEIKAGVACLSSGRDTSPSRSLAKFSVKARGSGSLRSRSRSRSKSRSSSRSRSKSSSTPKKLQ